MKRKTLILAVLAFALILTSGIGTALAYFTANDEASGKATISLGYTTEYDESYSNGVKSLTVTNNSSSTSSVFVRARAYSVLSLTYGGTNWSTSGDWAYYSEPLAPGASSSGFTVSFTLPEDAEEGDQYSVAIVYETVIAVDADGDGDIDSADMSGSWELGSGSVVVVSSETSDVTKD